MEPPLLVKILFYASGGIAVLAGLLDWKWFMKSGNARFLVGLLGYGKARLAYCVLGAMLISIAFFIIN